MDAGLLEFSSEDGPYDETTAHASSGEEEEGSTTEFVDEETHREGGDEVYDVQDAVDF